MDTVRVYIPGSDGRAGAAELKPTATAASQHRFLVYHYDHLGSIQTITNWGTATLSTESDSSRKSLFSYEPWGRNRNPVSWLGDASNQSTYSAGNGTDSTPRGFTGHEMLEGPFVHMNGRIYSPILSRFMSADPIVQSPANLQSYNRYSYCMNNPLTYVDPTGYLWEDFKEGIIGIYHAYVGWAPPCSENQYRNDSRSYQEPDIGGAATRELVDKSTEAIALQNDLLNMAADMTPGVSQAKFAVELGAGRDNWGLGARFDRVEVGASAAVAELIPFFSFSAQKQIERVKITPAHIDDLSALASGIDISNPIPNSFKFARVITPDTVADLKKGMSPNLSNYPGALEAFITTSESLPAGLEKSQIAELLTIPEENIGGILRFIIPNADGVATPINRNIPGFINGGRTRGDTPEFVVPNQRIDNFKYTLEVFK